MDGYSYSDIFATKGIEYLVIITFLTLLVPFWLLLNREGKVAGQLKKVLGVLSAGILNIPQGLFYSRNHTWLFMERSGEAKVGIDDLLLHITGSVTFTLTKNPGEMIRKGDLLTEIAQNGKLLRITSPVSGKIINTNTLINENPGILNQDPYVRGWLYKIKPSNWIAETKTCYFAEEATSWSANELERFKDFVAGSMKNYMPVPSMMILQDGGELYDHTLSTLPREIWNDFEKEFLAL